MKLFLLLVSVFSMHVGKAQVNFNFCNYSQKEFNSDTCCWRKLSKFDSFTVAGNLIVSYLHCANEKLNKYALKWHAGQMFGLAGLNTKSKKYFKKTYTVFSKWFGGKDGKAWYYYAKGSVAFLDRKKNRLKKIIGKWDKRIPKDVNYESLLKLYNNFDKSYRLALLD